ncbi:ComF family protein [Psychrobacter sp. I-STPA6b]|uniref:ComF family protein n=1 Tax=Psychrobacter sp. I-STPA6b TaxID=2585718 RepID=UPI001D0CAF01|nr:ComF family protein [Psychrobacter sp. I-STPA6b]
MMACIERLAPYQLGIWVAQYIKSTCSICGDSIARAADRFHNSEGIVCTPCHNDISWFPSPLTIQLDISKCWALDVKLTVQPISTYENSIAEAMVAFKYNENLSALPTLVYALRQLAKPAGCNAGNSVILPMPTTTKRLKKRGFYPVLILAHYLSKHWKIPLWDGVIRTDDVHSQRGLSREERLVNINNAFTLTKVPPVQRIILFDDVATTGASLRALAESLLDADHHIDLSAYTIAHGNSQR